MEMLTRCGACTFYNKNKNSCHLNRIKAYEESGAETGLDENGNVVIVERLCNAFRANNWHPEIKDVYRLEELVKLEIRKSFELAVFVDNPLANLDMIVKSAESQTVRFSSVVIVSNVSDAISHQVCDKIKQFPKWRHEVFKLTNCRNYQKNFICNKSECQYVVFAEHTSFLPRNFNQVVNDAINEKMRQFFIVDAADVEVRSRQLVRMYMEKYENDLLEYLKVTEPKMVVKYADLHN